jgi:hypothetical protein
MLGRRSREVPSTIFRSRTLKSVSGLSVRGRNDETRGR